MGTLLIVLVVIAYLFVALTVKAYYKLNRWDDILDEEPYIIGLLWPIYVAFRLIAWPLSNASGLIEHQMIKAKAAKDEAKKQVKLRVPLHIIDREQQEAEQEVEKFLTQDKERRHSL